MGCRPTSQAVVLLLERFVGYGPQPSGAGVVLSSAAAPSRGKAQRFLELRAKTVPEQLLQSRAAGGAGRDGASRGLDGAVEDHILKHLLTALRRTTLRQTRLEAPNIGKLLA